MTAALQPKESLKEQFFRHALGRYFLKNSEKISSYGFLAGNGILTIKDGFAMNLTNMGGLMFMGCAIALRLSKKFPNVAYRVNGLLGIAGAAMLACASYQKNANLPHAVTTGLGFGIPSVMILFEKELAALSTNWQDSQNGFKRKFSDFCRYPVSGSAAVDMLGIGSMYKRALVEADIGIAFACALWFCAECGLAANDPRLQKQFETFNKKSAEPSAPASP